MSDSDSDTPVEGVELLGLPNVSKTKDTSDDHDSEELKSGGAKSAAGEAQSSKRIEALMKIRGEAKSLVSKTEKKKPLYLS